MSALHYADVELDDDGGALSVLFMCTGGPDDVCHQWCAQGCEESCTAPPKRRPADPLNFVEGTYITAGHRWADTGSCRIVDWFDAVGWRDTGWTQDDNEISAEQLRPGRHLIEEEWTGDDYIWRYAPEPAVTDAGVPR